MAVSYEELEGSPQFYADVKFNAREIRRLVCNWEDRWDVANYVSSNRSPHSDLFFYSLEVTPFGDGQTFSRITGSNPISYEKALIKVEYRNLEQSESLISVTEDLKGETHMVRLDPGDLRYEDGTPLSAGDYVAYPQCQVTWTKTIVSPYAVSGLNVFLINKININPVASQQFGVVFAPNTLLCRNILVAYKSLPGGGGRYTYSIERIFNPFTWGMWVDKYGQPKRLKSKRTDRFISPYLPAYFAF